MHVAPTRPSQGLEAVWPQSREGMWGGRHLGSRFSGSWALRDLHLAAEPMSKVRSPSLMFGSAASFQGDPRRH